MNLRWQHHYFILYFCTNIGRSISQMCWLKQSLFVALYANSESSKKGVKNTYFGYNPKSACHNSKSIKDILMTFFDSGS